MSWLGYRVDSPGGCVGTVEAIEPGNSAPLLAVRLGKAGLRLGFFPLGDVSRVDVLSRVVVLSRLDLQRSERRALAEAA